MWADIVGNHPKITNLLPQDITLIVWAYHGATDFEEQIKPIAGSGLNFWVAPGVSCWGNVFPNLAEARTNIFNLIRDGKKYQATGVLNTTWDDDGLNLFENNWLPLAWGAELSWHAPNTEYDFGGINDHFAFGNVTSIAVYMKMFEKIYDILDISQSFKPEYMMYIYLQKHNTYTIERCYIDYIWGSYHFQLLLDGKYP